MEFMTTGFVSTMSTWFSLLGFGLIPSIAWVYKLWKNFPEKQLSDKKENYKIVSDFFDKHKNISTVHPLELETLYSSIFKGKTMTADEICYCLDKKTLLIFFQCFK